MEAIRTYDKMEDLLFELLSCEAWREKIYPLVVDEIINKAPLIGYFIVFFNNYLDV